MTKAKAFYDYATPMKYVKLYFCDSTSLQTRFIYVDMAISRRTEYNKIFLVYEI